MLIWFARRMEEYTGEGGLQSSRDPMEHAGGAGDGADAGYLADSLVEQSGDEREGDTWDDWLDEEEDEDAEGLGERTWRVEAERYRSRGWQAGMEEARPPAAALAFPPALAEACARRLPLARMQAAAAVLNTALPQLQGDMKALETRLAVEEEAELSGMAHLTWGGLGNAVRARKEGDGEGMIELCTMLSEALATAGAPADSLGALTGALGGASPEVAASASFAAPVARLQRRRPE